MCKMYLSDGMRSGIPCNNTIYFKEREKKTKRMCKKYKILFYSI